MIIAGWPRRGRSSERLSSISAGWRRVGASLSMLPCSSRRAWIRRVSREPSGMAVGMARESGHREWTALALAGRGRVLRACGDAAGARRVHEEMLETARELGTSLWTADALGNLGEDLLLAGDDEAAGRYLAEAIAKAGGGIKHALRPPIPQGQLGLRPRPAQTTLPPAPPLPPL